MEIWVDADACPAVIKDILFRVAERLQLQVTLIANQLIRVPGSRFIRAIQVPSGPDVADTEIVERLAPGDLVITGDIPLAARVLEKGGDALNAGVHGRVAQRRRRHRRPQRLQPGRPPAVREFPRPLPGPPPSCQASYLKT